jgi:hypothetical protein
MRRPPLPFSYINPLNKQENISIIGERRSGRMLYLRIEPNDKTGRRLKRLKRDLAAAVRFFWRTIQGHDGRVGPKAPIAEGGPLGLAEGGTDGTGSPGGRGPPCRRVDQRLRRRKNRIVQASRFPPGARPFPDLVWRTRDKKSVRPLRASLFPEPFRY